MAADYGRMAGAVVPVYLVLLAGYAVRRLGWLSAEADASLLRVTVNLLIPCLIVDSILGNPALRDPANLLWPPLVGFCTVVVGYAVAMGAAWLAMGREAAGGDRGRTFAFTVGLYNYGYIPVPLVLALFDAGTMGVLFAHNLGVELALWGAGLMVLSGGASNWRKVAGGPVWAVLAGLALDAWVGRGAVPPFLLGTMDSLGGAAVPLGVLLSGATLADWMAREHFSRRELSLGVGACALRLGVLPLLFVGAAVLLPVSAELKRVMVVQAAMPSAMVPIVLARHYGGSAATAVVIVGLTSAIGLVTIPFWLQTGLAWVTGR